MGYAKEMKYQICKRLVEEEITIEKAMITCGASKSTISF